MNGISTTYPSTGFRTPDFWTINESTVLYKRHPPSHHPPYLPTKVSSSSRNFAKYLRSSSSLSVTSIDKFHWKRRQAAWTLNNRGETQQSTIRGQIGGKRDSGGLGFWVPLSKNPERKSGNPMKGIQNHQFTHLLQQWNDQNQMLEVTSGKV